MRAESIHLFICPSTSWSRTRLSVLNQPLEFGWHPICIASSKGNVARLRRTDMVLQRTTDSLHSESVGFTRESIANLSNFAMADLSAEELSQIIRLIEDHIPQPHWADSIEQCDEATLLRMAFRARECCRHLVACENGLKQPDECDNNCGCPHCG